MKILITGAAGFVGKNLIAQLENIRDGKEKSSPLTEALTRQGKSAADIEILSCVRGTSDEELDAYCREADFIVHLAGVNRTQTESDFMEGNAGFTEKLLAFLEKPGKALSRDNILSLVWGKSYQGDLKVVDVNIRRLRLKIEEDAAQPKHITTVWGYGYKWEG